MLDIVTNEIDQKDKVVLTAGNTLRWGCIEERDVQFVRQSVVFVSNYWKHNILWAFFFYLFHVYSLIPNLITKQINISKSRILMF